jgi:hypothetical protein
MRAKILDRKKVYGGARRRAPASSVDTPALADTPVLTTGTIGEAPAKAARLDKADTIELARQTLCAICISSDAPSNAKATAARTLLELVGALGRHADPSAMNTVPASEMSLEQLEDRIRALTSH